MSQQTPHATPSYRPGIALHQDFWQCQRLPPAFPAPTSALQTTLVRVVVLGGSVGLVDGVVNMINHGALTPVSDITDAGGTSYPVEYLCEGRTYALDVSGMPGPTARGSGMLSFYDDFVVVCVYDVGSMKECERAERVGELVGSEEESGFGVVCFLVVGSGGGKTGAREDEDGARVQGGNVVRLDCDVQDWSEVNGVFAGIVEKLHGRADEGSKTDAVGIDRSRRERTQIKASQCLEVLAKVVNGPMA